MKRAGIVAIAVPALTVGTVALVSAYQADNDFQPFNTDRELQKNQVVFSDDEKAAGEQEQQQGHYLILHFHLVLLLVGTLTINSVHDFGKASVNSRVYLREITL